MDFKSGLPNLGTLAQMMFRIKLKIQELTYPQKLANLKYRIIGGFGDERDGPCEAEICL